MKQEGEISVIDARELVAAAFTSSGLSVSEIQTRDYPDETIFILLVSPSSLQKAASLANELDRQLRDQGFAGFITVRETDTESELDVGRLQGGVRDERAERFARLLTERSRTSEVQPSLSYVKDAAANLSAVLAARHQLIFGRRGAGKTALMLEAKRRIETAGNVTSWLNVQTVRREETPRIFLWILKQIADSLATRTGYERTSPAAHGAVSDLADRITEGLSANEMSSVEAAKYVPYAQRSLRRVLASWDRRLFIFLDDFHYAPRNQQAEILDLLHGCVRDTNAWLKVASIRHLTSWYRPSPQMGLQTGQDADLIDLDVTLEDPSRAKAFLEEVLARYGEHVNISGLWQLFHPQALDRLLLASGAVPRDYLVLAAASIRRARSREKARQVGGQDVNNAAGAAAQIKLRELEEDLAGSEALSQVTLATLQNIRDFCLQQTSWTYFRIDFRDKEQNSEEYALLQSVVDLRLTHLISPSVSHESKAGERFEVFMLDLSQFTGQRLKKNIQVLDFVGGHFVAKKTGVRGSASVGNTPKRLIQILRRPPLFELSRLTPARSAEAGPDKQ